MAPHSRYEGVADYLTADHRRIDQLLGETARFVSDGQFRPAQLSFNALDQGLRRHIRLEESIIFPVFERRTGIAGPVAVMRSEHRRLEEHLLALDTALAAADRSAFAATVRQLARLLGDHNRKEELIIYTKTEQVLEPQTLGAVAAELRRA